MIKSVTIAAEIDTAADLAQLVVAWLSTANETEIELFRAFMVGFSDGFPNSVAEDKNADSSVKKEIPDA